jgi:hypothetical protein
MCHCEVEELMMKIQLLFSATLLCLSFPAAAQGAATGTVAESKAGQSAVSLEVEPKLDDGRLVLKLAAQNKASTAVQFGPADVTIAKANGEPIALMSLPQLTNDVRMAAGMKPDATAPTSNAYATQGMTTDATGHLDVSNFNGSMGISQGQIVRDTTRSKPTITKAQAEEQIAALKQAILQDSSVPPGQIAVGELVSAPLKLTPGEDRTIHVWVKIGGDEHTFTVAAPAQ